MERYVSESRNLCCRLLSWFEIDNAADNEAGFPTACYSGSTSHPSLYITHSLHPFVIFFSETSSSITNFFFFTKASWLGPLALDPIPVEKEDVIHIPEPSKRVTDGMDKIFPSSGVLFKKTIKAAQELTSGSDLAAAKAAKQQVLKHLQDYKNTVLAFCGISPEEDMVLAGGNKRAKTQSKDASLSKRKANASTVPASGEPTKKNSCIQ